MDKVKHYEMILNRFCGRLKLAHYRIAEAVKLPSHDLAFVTILDLSDKSYYYIDVRETENTDMIKLGRLEYDNGKIKLEQHNVLNCSELLDELPESIVEPMRTKSEFNEQLFELLNVSNYFMFDFVQEQLGLKPCLYGLKKKRNGEITVKHFPFSIAYQN